MADRNLTEARRIVDSAEANSALRIHVDGVVQGVGFRPFVYSLAMRHELAGWVRNTSAGVDIEIQGPSADLERFLVEIEAEAPPLARIERVVWDAIPMGPFNEFTIKPSTRASGDFQPISPDVAMCPDCRRELFDEKDRRYRYPFINCTNCGPRFTIIRQLPYDRPATTMADFELCPQCEAEYTDPLDRRFHAQPIACPQCGPQVSLETESQTTARGEQAIQQARSLLRRGGIIGLKGLGGYQLVCDAADEKAVARLRRLKQRPAKPFALMVADENAAAALCQISEAELGLLTSRQRPIVLLMKEAEADIATKVAPGQQKLGVMLPYTPLHELLLEPAAAFPRALVMTSANRRGEPIIHRDQPARELLAQGVDGMLVHNRPIEQRCDDSVFVVFEEDPYPLRRARGYAPFPIELSEALPSVLATGAELKHTFCLTKERRAFVSQHIGDLSNYETLQAFEQALRHFEGIFQIQPQAIAHDLHPDYLSTRLALEKSQAGNLPAYAIQHHQAHIASCLAEHQHTFDEPAMGFAYDGTGYGLDGTIWGGEAFVYSEGSFTRAFHLRSSRMPGGDQAIRQPWRLALAWLKAAGIDWDPDLPPMPDLEASQLAILEQQLDQGINSPATSSVGRLFDAVASLIGVRQQVHYEAQAAMELEALVNPAETGAYEFELAGDTFDPAPMLVELLGDLRAGLEPGLIAARFHRGLAQVTLDMSRRLRREYGLSKVALSGGVWQNLRLLQWTVQLLQADGFEPLLQRLVPANDGGISLGQAWLAGHYCTRDMDPAALPNITNGRIKE